MTPFGRQLDKWLRHRQKSQTQLAADLNVHPSQVSRTISGRRKVKLDEVGRILDFLQVTREEFERGPQLEVAKPILPDRQLRVAILRSGHLQYVESIHRSFCHQLRAMADRRLLEPFDHFVLPNRPRSSDEVLQETTRFLGNVRSQEADFLVGIGSAACIAMRQCLKDNYGKTKPVYCLGVTNPSRHDLISEDTDRAVVALRYGAGLDKLLELVHDHLLQDLDLARRRLTFLFDPTLPHDEAAQRELESGDLAQQCRRDGSDRIVSVPINRNCKWEEVLIDEERIYFGWYGLECSLIEDEIPPTLLASRTILSTLSRHAQEHIVPVAIQPNDEEIGREGARLLLQDWAARSAGEANGHPRPMVSFDDMYWISERQLNKMQQRLAFQMSTQILEDPRCEFCRDSNPPTPQASKAGDAK